MSKKRKRKQNGKSYNPALAVTEGIAHSGASSPTVSHCMIVKNEESNMEHALGWGKDILTEQIVVDTGSSDRTVEIAQRMGAKVFHFDWIDDFAAARNYSIEQASGDWFVVLDADEFFTREDAEKLLEYIGKIQADPNLSNKYKVIGCSLYNVAETGEIISTVKATRVYKNIKSHRYAGRVHEIIAAKPHELIWVEDIKIIHRTSLETRAELGKVERNIKLIRAELAENPQSLDLKGYLAEALITSDIEQDIKEGESLFNELIDKSSTKKATDMLTRKAYNYFLLKNVENPEKIEYCTELCRRAMKDFPGWLDFEYFYTIILNNSGEHEQALQLAIKIEKKLSAEQYLANSEILAAKPGLLYAQSMIAAQELQDIEKVIKYATIILAAEKRLMGVLGPYIITLLNNGASEDELVKTLGNIYNLDDPKDLLIIARAAKDYGAIPFAQKIVAMAGKLMG
ncbi:MAG: glycosyltransferase family 2 protein [Oscillospiraceae bacterium]|nr:glycosyltransferase family 2 protein [Oscillospiraceae bacterium]MCL2278975.1 glycosyltransferase family 2 protein [Oscillospiraceae bacterium]